MLGEMSIFTKEQPHVEAVLGFCGFSLTHV